MSVWNFKWEEHTIIVAYRIDRDTRGLHSGNIYALQNALGLHTKFIYSLHIDGRCLKINKKDFYGILNPKFDIENSSIIFLEQDDPSFLNLEGRIIEKNGRPHNVTSKLTHSPCKCHVWIDDELVSSKGTMVVKNESVEYATQTDDEPETIGKAEKLEQAQKPEKEKQTDIYEILMDAVCCIMCADRKVTTRERRAIHTVLERTKAPWNEEQINNRINDFIQRVNNEGLNNVIQQTCKKLPEFKKRGKENVLAVCLDFMARADGSVDENEKQLIEKFKSAVGIETGDSVPQIGSPPSKKEKKTGEEEQIPANSASLPDDAIKSSEPILPDGNIENHINMLWDSAKKLGWSKSDCEKKILLYTELLGFVKKDSQTSVCFRNRGLCYKSLENYDAAIVDFTSEMEIHKKQGEPALLCSDLLQECRGLKRKAEAEAGDDNKSKIIREMVQLERNLIQTGPAFEAAFEKLFSYLRDKNPDIRDEASRMLADNNHVLKNLVLPHDIGKVLLRL
jgi:tellurite resistance protein